jgi:rubredoxin-NAD+ reductase
MSAGSVAPVVIVGAGLAAWTTARELRKRDAAVPIVLVTQDSGDFYAKPTLSNAFGQKRSPQQLVTTAAADMAANQIGAVMTKYGQVQSLKTQWCLLGVVTKKVLSLKLILSFGHHLTLLS